MEYYSAIKKNEISQFEAAWMDLENIILIDVSQTEKRQMLYITYMWDLKNNTNDSVYKTERDSQT